MLVSRVQKIFFLFVLAFLLVKPSQALSPCNNLGIFKKFLSSNNILKYSNLPLKLLRGDKRSNRKILTCLEGDFIHGRKSFVGQFDSESIHVEEGSENLFSGEVKRIVSNSFPFEREYNEPFDLTLGTVFKIFDQVVDSTYENAYLTVDIPLLKKKCVYELELNIEIKVQQEKNLKLEA